VICTHGLEHRKTGFMVGSIGSFHAEDSTSQPAFQSLNLHIGTLSPVEYSIHPTVKRVSYNTCMSNGIKQGQVCDQVQRVGAIVVITEHDGEVNVVLEDNRLRLLRVPLWPSDSEALAVGVEFIDESDDIVPQFPIWRKRCGEVHRMGSPNVRRDLATLKNESPRLLLVGPVFQEEPTRAVEDEIALNSGRTLELR